MDAIGSVAFSMTIRQACFEPMNRSTDELHLNKKAMQTTPSFQLTFPPLTTSGVWCFHGFPETKVGCKAGGLCGHRSLPLYFAGVTRCPVIPGCFSPVTRWCFSPEFCAPNHRDIRDRLLTPKLWVHLGIHPGRLTWNLQVTHLERKIIFQTSMIMFHVNLQGCNWGES